jgi:hypothetical protein
VKTTGRWTSVKEGKEAEERQDGNQMDIYLSPHPSLLQVKSGSVGEAASQLLSERCSTTCVDCFSFCMRGDKEESGLGLACLSLILSVFVSRTTHELLVEDWRGRQCGRWQDHPARRPCDQFDPTLSPRS